MPRRFLPAAAVVIAIVLAAVLVERLIVSDEERVELAYDALRAAVQDEDGAALEALLTSDFSFSGPRPIGEGTRDTVMPRFEEFWEMADGVGLLPRGTKEITVVGALATLRTPQLVRFKVGGQFIAYRADAVLTYDRIGDRYVLAQIEVTDLRPGIL